MLEILDNQVDMDVVLIKRRKNIKDTVRKENSINSGDLESIRGIRKVTICTKRLYWVIT